MNPINPAAPTVVTLTENEKKNGYELRFPGPINDIWSGLLDLNGWNFTKSRQDPRWYIRRNPKSKIFAERVVAKYNAQLTASTEKVIVSHGGEVITGGNPCQKTTEIKRVATTLSVLRPRFV